MNPATTDIGARIRSAREQRGLTREDISEVTKLSAIIVAAIEENQFGRLPGGMFRTAYIRTVADAVGVDAEQLVGAYRAAFDAEPPPAAPLPISAGSAAVRGWTPVALIVVVALLAGVWPDLREDDAPAEERLEVAHLWSQLTALPVAVAEAAPVEAAPATTRPMASLELELRTTAVCWVSLIADGERLIYRLMQPGEHAVANANDAMTLHVGNAGAVAYSVNGVAGRSLGGDGEVATLQLTRDDNGSS